MRVGVAQDYKRRSENKSYWMTMWRYKRKEWRRMRTSWKQGKGNRTWKHRRCQRTMKSSRFVCTWWFLINVSVYTYMYLWRYSASLRAFYPGALWCLFGMYERVPNEIQQVRIVCKFFMCLCVYVHACIWDSAGSRRGCFFFLWSCVCVLVSWSPYVRTDIWCTCAFMYVCVVRSSRLALCFCLSVFVCACVAACTHAPCTSLGICTCVRVCCVHIHTRTHRHSEPDANILLYRHFKYYLCISMCVYVYSFRPFKVSTTFKALFIDSSHI